MGIVAVEVLMYVRMLKKRGMQIGGKYTLTDLVRVAKARYVYYTIF
jgi:hypothetical protein